MKFAMSYSCGKDSTLALHKAVASGHTPVALIVMVNKEVRRSFFHGADSDMLKQYSKALEIPLISAASGGEDYHLEMEKALAKAKEMGAEAACFGDIDLEQNRAWSEERCRNTGLKAMFPLWHAGREENVHELISLGYKCMIKSINNTLLPKSLLGRIIDEEVLRQMAECGIDLCGENGEYHTLTVAGPVFRTPLHFETGEILDFGDYSAADIIKPQKKFTASGKEINL